MRPQDYDEAPVVLCLYIICNQLALSKEFNNSGSKYMYQDNGDTTYTNWCPFTFDQLFKKKFFQTIKSLDRYSDRFIINSA